MLARVAESAFKEAIGRFASGVTVVTTRVEGEDFGTTANAVSSLCLEPPMLLVCLNRTSVTQRAIVSAGWFAVNILGEEQEDLARRFATKSAAKFREGDIERRNSGLPLIASAIGHLECRVSSTASRGTHAVVFAAVERAAWTDGSPLIYYRGRFGRLLTTWN